MNTAAGWPTTTPIPVIPPADVLRRLTALQTATVADLGGQWRQLYGSEPPRFSRPYLQSRLAYRIQELAYGGLKPETVATRGAGREARRRQHHAAPGPRRRPADRGTRLVREYQGVEHVVTVLRDGIRVSRAALIARSRPLPGTSPARAGTA